MELLQQAPPPGHRANGSLEPDLPIMRRRRGRRKNVEGLELLFMGSKRAGGVRSVHVFILIDTRDRNVGDDGKR